MYRSGYGSNFPLGEVPTLWYTAEVMKGCTILIAEDEVSIRRALVDALQTDGYETLEAENGYQALELLLTHEVSLLLLDLNMPQVSGFQVLTAMKKECPGIPVIILTSRGEETDRIKGLRLGADDYVVKPFSVGELLARIQAVLRRSPERPKYPVIMRFPEGKLIPETRTLQFDNGCSSQLTEKECELFLYFLRHPNRVISQEELLLRIWNSRVRASETRLIAVTLTRLKDKLGSDSPSAQNFENIRGRGYRWKSEIPS